MRWICPICGSRNYMRVVLSRGKQEYASQFFTCLGCSVIFIEPMLFAKAADVREIYLQPVAEMAHVDSNERLAFERRFWETRAARLNGEIQATEARIIELWRRGRLE